MNPEQAAHLQQQGPSTRDELAELIGAVNAVTMRLEASHAQLQSQVSQLTQELGEANAQIERSRRLAALGEMAAGIAHEIRNPLGSIRLFASMLEEDLRQGAPKQAQFASKITSAAKIMENIVSDVLTFSREFKLRLAPIDVAAFIDRSLEACHHDGIPLWRNVKVVTSVKAPAGKASREDSILTFEGDDSLMLQAMSNIIRNAYEAMASVKGDCKHTLTITAQRRTVAAKDGKMVPCIAMAISDSGPGIPQEVSSRMFNPFFTTRDAGTGLGLAIVHRIIDAHGGRINVLNNTKRGGSSTSPGATIEVIIPQRSDSSSLHTMQASTSATVNQSSPLHHTLEDAA